jgi:hypothetical protein
MNLTKNISITILDKLILNGSVDEKNYKSNVCLYNFIDR